MKEFNLNSAEKYKDGSPMMDDLPVQLVRLTKRIELLEKKVNICQHNQEHVFVRDLRIFDGDLENLKYRLQEIEEKICKKQSNQFDIHFCEEDCCPHWKTCPHTLEDKHLCPYLPHDTDSNLKYLEQVFKEFAKTQDDIVEEHDARISELEHMYENIIEDMCIVKERLCNITSIITDSDKYAHIFSNFCGNCTHCDHGKQGDDEVYVCELSAEIIDPDSASCSMFEPPF